METLKSSAKIKTDMTATEGKEALIRLTASVRQGILVDAEIDEETDHTRMITITDPTVNGHLAPRFDFDYNLRPSGKFHAMSWKDSSITYEEAMFLYSFVLLQKPKSILETGMGLALSTIHMAQALFDSDKGEIFTIDIDNNAIRRGVNAIEAYGFKEVITIVSQDSARYISKWDRPLDLVHLDTTAQLVQKEFDMVAKHIKIGGHCISRYSLKLPGDGIWRYMELAGPTGLHIYQKMAERTDMDEPVNLTKKPSAKKKPVKFKPEQV